MGIFLMAIIATNTWWSGKSMGIFLVVSIITRISARDAGFIQSCGGLVASGHIRGPSGPFGRPFGPSRLSKKKIIKEKKEFVGILRETTKNIHLLGGHSWSHSWSSWSSWWSSWCLASLPFNYILPEDSKNIWYMGICCNYSNQEHPHTWRTFLKKFLIILFFLMVIMMSGITTIQLHVARGL